MLRGRHPPAVERNRVNGPVALITTFAWTENSVPVSRSRAVTPSTSPSASSAEADDLDVVQQRRALLERGGHQIDQQARVVELAVVVDDAAAQAVGVDGWQARERFLVREDLRMRRSRTCPASRL